MNYTCYGRIIPPLQQVADGGRYGHQHGARHGREISPLQTTITITNSNNTRQNSTPNIVVKHGQENSDSREEPPSPRRTPPTEEQDDRASLAYPSLDLRSGWVRGVPCRPRKPALTARASGRCGVDFARGRREMRSVACGVGLCGLSSGGL